MVRLAPQVAVECICLAPQAVAECLAPLAEVEGSLIALVDKGCEVGKDREM